MIDAELKKTLRNDPIVEYDIPKRIFREAAAAGEEDLVISKDLVQATQVNMLAELWEF